MSDAVLRVRNLQKTFRIGFFRKRVEAVRGVDFEVRDGEIFGLLGPNGAGKTTTIKMILGLIFPNAGEIDLFGGRPGQPATMRRVGYLPENPYVYQYLRPLEFLDLCGRLVGLDRTERVKKSEQLVEKVGLAHAVDRPIGKFSKGMMQRIGLAQSLLHDPELLILDEPLSGLDPIGRKEVRDLVLEHRDRGRTVLFTSHILSDVEMLCDRVGILNQGKMTHYGPLDELLRPEFLTSEVVLGDVSEDLEAELAQLADDLAHRQDHVVVHIEGADGAQPIIEHAVAAGAQVIAVTPGRETLESLFVREALAAHDSGSAEDDPP